jgi:hypothetical protein
MQIGELADLAGALAGPHRACCVTTVDVGLVEDDITPMWLEDVTG